jgi:hypothetical protein
MPVVLYRTSCDGRQRTLGKCSNDSGAQSSNMMIARVTDVWFGSKTEILIASTFGHPRKRTSGRHALRSAKCQQQKTLDREAYAWGSSEPLPCCLPRDGERLSDNCPAHLAFAEDVGDILHRSPDPFEGTIVCG